MEYMQKYTGYEYIEEIKNTEKLPHKNVSVKRYFVMLLLSVCFVFLLKFVVLPCLYKTVFNESIFIVSGGEEC